MSGFFLVLVSFVSCIRFLLVMIWCEVELCYCDVMLGCIWIIVLLFLFLLIYMFVFGFVLKLCWGGS